MQSPSEKILAQCGPLLDTKTPHQKPRNPSDKSANLTYLNKPQTPGKSQFSGTRPLSVS